MNKKERKRMFFEDKAYYIIQNLKSIKKASLRACHKQTDPNKSGIIKNNPKSIKSKKSSRTFSLTPSEYQASICLEASLSFSFFLIFFINIFSIIFLFITYIENLESLQQQGKKAAAYAYVTEGVFDSNEDIIRLQKVIEAESPVGLLSLSKYKLRVQCVVKPWTGYDVIGGKKRLEEDSIVYMTEHGSVYHKNRACTHLALSIQAVASYGLSERMNEYGECYKICEYCGKNGIVTIVYITSYGNKYHTTIKCPGLKRTIKAIPLSQVKGVNPCKKCG